MNKWLRSDVLKIIAMVLMLIDHLGDTVFESLFLRATDYSLAMVFSTGYSVCKGIGRIAFPIFCYQLVKGFDYTKNRISYIRNIFIFALISEIPFNLMVAGKCFYNSHQNVMFTLFLGALLIMIFDKYTNPFIRAAATVILAFISYRLHFDYDAKGVVFVAIIYLLKEDREKLVQLGPVFALIAIFTVTLITTRNMQNAIRYCEFECYAVLAFFFMYLDNGKRQFGRWFKWLGYSFYPVHMMILYFISLYIQSIDTL